MLRLLQSSIFHFHFCFNIALTLLRVTPDTPNINWSIANNRSISKCNTTTKLLSRYNLQCNWFVPTAPVQELAHAGLGSWPLKATATAAIASV